MTVQSATAQASYQGNGAIEQFAVPFYFLDPTHLSVILVDSSTTPPTVIDQTLNSNYTVAGAGVENGGSITFMTAPTGTQTAIIRRNVPLTQLVHYVPNDPFPAATHEQALDQLTMAVQQLFALIANSLQTPIYETPQQPLLPAAQRANGMLGFDANGNLTYYPVPASVGAGDLTLEKFVADEQFTPGTTTALTLAYAYGTATNIQVYFDGTPQMPDQYTLSGYTLTFDEPIPVGIQNVYVRGGTTISQNLPAANSVGDAQLTWGVVLNRVCSSVEALRNLSKYIYSCAFVTGYYVAHDGGGGAYQLDPFDTTSADNGGTIIVANDGARWKLQVMGRVTARQFGVTANGTTDDTQAMLNAIAWLAGKGGGYLDCTDCQTILISRTLTIGNGTTTTASTINQVFLVGAGGTGPFSGDSGTTLLWGGLSGGTMMQLLGAMNGGGLLGGWTFDGNGVAARGLVVNHVSGGQFPFIKIKGCTGVYLTLTAQTNPDTIGGCRNNRFGIYITDTIESGATGLLIDGPTAITSVLQNVFDVIDMPISGTGAVGIQLGYCDFNKFGVVDISRQSAWTTSVGVLFVGSGPSGNQIFPSMNKFGCLAAGGGVSTNSTNGRPYGNTCDIYDLADSDGGVPTAAGFMGYAPNILPASGLGLRAIRFGFVNPGWTTATPAVPGGVGSGNKVTNTNTYTVVVYQETSTGNPSGQHIVDGQGTDNAITAVTPMFLLGPGESVYYTGTLPVSWAWFGLAD